MRHACTARRECALRSPCGMHAARVKCAHASAHAVHVRIHSDAARLQQPRRVALAVRSVLAQVVEELPAADVLHDDVEGVLRLVAALELGDARVHRDALQHRDLVQD